METWSNPALVQAFAWRVKAYFLLLAIMWCGLPVFFISLFMLIQKPPHPDAGWISTVGGCIVFLPVFIIQWLWKCPNCKAWLNTRNAYPSAGVDCGECRAQLYNPRGFYADPEPPRNPRADARDGKHYWIDPEAQSTFRWRIPFFRALSGFMAATLLFALVGVFTELWFIWVSGGLVLMMIAWFFRNHFWRCTHCGDHLDPKTEHPGRGQVLCHACGAVLWEAVPATTTGPASPRPAYRDASTAGGAYFQNTESFQRIMARYDDKIGRAIDAQDFGKLSRLMDEAEAETRRDIQEQTDQRLGKSGRNHPPIQTGSKK